MKIIISVIYAYFNTPTEITNSIESLPEAIGDISYEIIIVDNSSNRRIPLKVKKNLNVRVITNDSNRGFGVALNQGAMLAQGEYLFFLNTDTVCEKLSIQHLYERIKKTSSIGLIAPKLINRKGSALSNISKKPSVSSTIVVYSSLKYLPFGKKLYSKFHMLHQDLEKEQYVDTVGGAAMLFQSKVFNRIGGFDDRFFLYFEEADICNRLKKSGYSVLYYPNARITHLVGQSLKDKKLIKKHFERSRILYSQKYFGRLTALSIEIIIRLLQTTNIILLTIVALSAFLNLYKIETQMVFIGDFGRDFIEARNMILTGNIPLLGIPSSVVWLHQGPLSIYFIAFALKLGNFNTVAPAVLYSVLGVVTTYLIFVAGRMLFDSRVGLLASALFATSPLVVINSRLPYHTAPIPFFATLFLLFLLWYLRSRKLFFLFLTFLFLGLLLQLELSNFVLVIFIFLVFTILKVRIGKRDLVVSSVGLSFGVLPFLLHDITNGFVQIGGLLLWVVNRIRLFFGFTISGNSTNVYAPTAIITIWEQLVRFVFPLKAFIAGVCILATVIFSVKALTKFQKIEKQSIVILSLWMLIAILGFIIHARPGTAYFPIIFTPLALLLGYSFSKLISRNFFLLVFFMILISTNCIILVKYEYFLQTKNSDGSILFDWKYGLGSSVEDQNTVVDRIISDSQGKEFNLIPGGHISMFETGIDNYKYLAWLKTGKDLKFSNLNYTIYHSKDEVQGKEIFFKTSYIFVVKNEK